MTTTKRPSLQGLNAAMAPNVDDPLGTNIKRRGMDSYYEEARKSDPRYASGPLPDPQWEGFLQAMQDQHVTRVGQDVARPQGIASDPTQPGWENPPMDVNGMTTQDIENAHLMKSNNIATPASFQGLLKAHRR